MSSKLSFSLKFKRLHSFYTVHPQIASLEKSHWRNNFQIKTLNGKGKKKRMNKTLNLIVIVQLEKCEYRTERNIFGSWKMFVYYPQMFVRFVFLF